MQRSIYVRPIGLSGIAAPADAIDEATPSGAVCRSPAGAALRGRRGLVRERRAASSRRVSLAGGRLRARLGSRDAGRRARPSRRSPRRAPRLAGLSLDRPRIMGIVNVTPDSFSDGGQHASAQAAIDHGLQLADGRRRHPRHRRRDRRGPAPTPCRSTKSCAASSRSSRACARAPRRVISIDTRKAEVMRRAAERRRRHPQRRLGADARSRRRSTSPPRRACR